MKASLGLCAATALGVVGFMKAKRGHKKVELEEYDDETVEKALAAFKNAPLSSHLQLRSGEFKVIVKARKGVMTTVELDSEYYESAPTEKDPKGKNNTNNVRNPPNTTGNGKGKGSTEAIVHNKPYAEVGKEYKCVDFSSFDFLNLATDKAVLQSAATGLGKYGPGACGPRGFYGSLDIFIQLEERLAKYMGFQSCALYSYELLLFPSVIPTLITEKGQSVIVPVINHTTKKDGKEINKYTAPILPTIRNGCKLGYATLVEVPVDVEISVDDLSTVSINTNKLEEACKKLHEAWIVLEAGRNGITFSVLEDIYKIAHKHGCSLCADCTYLKETYIGAKRSSRLPVDVALVGLATGFGGVGGAVLSTKDIVDRQRLGGKAYVFSAAPPPPSICGVLESLNILGEGDVSSLLLRESAAIKEFVASVAKSGVCYIADYTEGSPIITLALDPGYRPEVGVRQICEELMAKGYLVSPNGYERRELLVCVKAGMTSAQLVGLVAAMK